ncbi:outer membrane protein assembly factor BamD [Rufibacter immobilis]|uniref:Outer membrane protein assembly factor BamD n=1 Tax=Rufibacter immobilis TaxID=1348778 RepID=A0A3M9MQ85_9BACT|nr:tetratricopeptide repeat protein [Rufibacter immobilis]RNI27694.1 outer membrane protein assembly factor BamD [Rufibacter immobilis]
MKLPHKFALATVLLGGAQVAHAQHPLTFRSEERFFHEGLELFDREKFGAAQQAFGEYIRLINDPQKTADAQYYYAISGLHLFHPDAEQLVLQFAARYPSHPKAATAFFELGTSLFDSKNYDKAIEYLEKAPADRLDEEQLKESDFKLGYSYFIKKNYTKAKQLFDRNKKGNHKYAYASSYYAGYLAYREGDYIGAKLDLKVAEQDENYRTAVPYMLTEVLYKEKNFAEVISYGEKSLSMSPRVQNPEEIELLVGDAYFQRNDFKSASKYFKGYAQGKRTLDKTVQYKMGIADYKNNDFKSSIQNLKAVAFHSDSLGQNASYHLGLSYLKDNNKQFALGAFDQARKLNIDRNVKEGATVKYAQLNYELGNFSEVINSLASFSKDFPESRFSDEVDDILSEAYLNSSNYLEAIQHIEKLPRRSHRINETYQRVTYYQAVKLYNDQLFQQAVAMLDKSLGFPYDKEIQAGSNFLKGEAYSIGQRWPQAINSYGAVFQTPNSGRTEFYVKSRYGIGYAYYNDKQYDKALTHFKAYLNDNSVRAGNPNYTDAMIRLADCYYVTKDYSQALTYYDQALASKTPDADYVHFQKGVVYNLTNRRDQAIQSLQTLLRSYPKSRYADDAVYQKGVIDFENANYAPAIASFSDLIDNHSGSTLVPNALQKRGVANMNLRRQNEAIADFKRVIDQYPTSPVANSALYSLQEALGAANQTEQLDTYLAKFKAANPESDALESVEFEAAKSLYFNEKYKQAIPKFEAFLKNYPASSSVPNARYFLGDSYYRSNDKENALRSLKEVAIQGKSEYLSKAVQRVADMEFENGNYTEAANFYSRLRDLAVNKKEQANALMGLMKSFYFTNDFNNTILIADELIARGNATLNAYNSALLYRGKASYALGRLDQAEKEFRTAATSATDENGAEAHYLLAEIFYKQKKYKEALDQGFAFSQTFGDYDLWLGKTFLLIADVYVAQNEAFQAKATLNSIIENSPLEEIKSEARAKLAELENTVSPANAPKN